MKKKSVKWIIITLLFVIGIMVMIFMFSAQNASDSKDLSGGITEKIIDIIRRFNMHFPGIGGGDWIDTGYSFFEDINHYVRKFAHFSEYAILGSALSMHIYSICAYKDKRYAFVHLLIAEIVSMLYASSDELHQLFVDGRGAKLKDVIIDSSGALFGALICLWIITQIQRKRNEKSGKN